MIVCLHDCVQTMVEIVDLMGQLRRLFPDDDVSTGGGGTSSGDAVEEDDTIRTHGAQPHTFALGKLTPHQVSVLLCV